MEVLTWSPTGVSGVGTPVLVAGQWQYTATYPTLIADSSVHLNMFRIRVASTAANLSNPNCSFTASNTIIVWVLNCSVVLKTDLIDFSGNLVNDHGQLHWTSTNEQAGVVYEVQRSDDKINFVTIGTVNGTAPEGFGNTYHLTDNSAINGAAYYRIKLAEGTAQKYSKIILLNTNPNEFSIKSLINPFSRNNIV